MLPRGAFCDAGAPVVNDQAVLMAVGAPGPRRDQGFMTRLIDVSAIRTVLGDWFEQEGTARKEGR